MVSAECLERGGEDRAVAARLAGCTYDGRALRHLRFGHVYASRSWLRISVVMALFGAVLVTGPVPPVAAATPRSLTLVKADSPDPAQVGKPLTYTLTVGSSLSSTVTGVTLTDTLPTQVALTSATTSHGSCAWGGGTVTCRLGRLDPGDRATVTIAVRPTTAGVITNSATVTANGVTRSTEATAQTMVSAADCGRVVTESIVLSSDIGPCAGNGVIVGADGITVDLGGRTIFGFAGPADGNAAGIRLPGRTRVTVTNGTVRDFDAGVVIRNGGLNTVTGLAVLDNVGPDEFEPPLGDGIYVSDSASNRIANNDVLRNGVYDGIGVWGGGSSGNIVENNRVEDNFGGAGTGPRGQGIIVNATGEDNGAIITNTTIIGNIVQRNGSAGIANINNTASRIVGNTIVGNGLRNGAGNGIGIQLGPFARAIGTTVVVAQNEVHGNGLSGIKVLTGAVGNEILDNDAADNVVVGELLAKCDLLAGSSTCDILRAIRGSGGDTDLQDLNPSCAGNVWLRNTWGTGGYFSPGTSVCLTVGGSGPPQTSSQTASATSADQISVGRRLLPS